MSEKFDIHGSLYINGTYRIYFPNEQTPKEVKLTSVKWRWAMTSDNNQWTNYGARNVNGKHVPHTPAILVFETLEENPEVIERDAYYFFDSNGEEIQKHVLSIESGKRTGTMTLRLSDAVKTTAFRIEQYRQELFSGDGRWAGGHRRRNTRKHKSKRSKKTRKNVRR